MGAGCSIPRKDYEKFKKEIKLDVSDEDLMMALANARVDLSTKYFDKNGKINQPLVEKVRNYLYSREKVEFYKKTESDFANRQRDNTIEEINKHRIEDRPSQYGEIYFPKQHLDAVQKLVEKLKEDTKIGYNIVQTSDPNVYAVSVQPAVFEAKKPTEEKKRKERTLEDVEREFNEVLAIFRKRVIKHDNSGLGYYTVDGTPNAISVSSFIYPSEKLPEDATLEEVEAAKKRAKEKDIMTLPGRKLGTTIDRIVRDFFSEKGLEESYPNFTKAQLEEFKGELEKLKESLEEEFHGKLGVDFQVYSGEFMMGMHFTHVKPNGETEELAMIGSPDLVIYTKEGDYYIRDVKAFHSRKEDVTPYTQQLSLYKAMLESIPGMKGRVKNVKLITFTTEYAMPDVEYGTKEYYTQKPESLQLFTNKTDGSIIPIQEDVDYSTPVLNILYSDSYNEEISQNLSDQMENMGLVELAIEYSTKGAKSEREEQKKEKTYKKKIDSSKPVSSSSSNLYADTTLTATERLFLANWAMNYITQLVNAIQKTGSAKVLGDKYDGINFSIMSRKQIFDTIPIGEMFNFIKENFYNPARKANLNPAARNKLKVAYDNFDELLRSGYSKLIALEGIAIAEQKVDAPITEAAVENMEDIVDGSILEEKEREFWQLGLRQISAKASLSREVRRMLEQLYVRDQNGNPVKDSFGLGFNTFVDSTVALNSILEWTQGAHTITDMEAALENHREGNPWVDTVLEAIKEEPFRSMFFKNCRKDFTTYSTVRIEFDNEGTASYKVETINTRGASKALLEGAVSMYKLGKMSELVAPKKGSVDGRGKVNAQRVTNLRATLENIREKLNESINDPQKFKQEVLPEQLERLAKFVTALGMTVSKSTLMDASVLDFKQGRATKNALAFAIIKEADYILKSMEYARDNNIEDYNPFAKETDLDDKLNVYNNFKKLASYFEKSVQDKIEASVFEGGKMYYSFAVPSYMGKMMHNLSNKLDLDNASYEAYLEKEFGSYRWFKEGVDDEGNPIWHNEWVRLLYESKEMRQGFQHKTQLAFDRTNYTELSELSYTLSLIHEFAYDKNEKWAWYRIPILANKPSSEFVRFKRYSGENYKEQLTKGFKSVMLQEVLRMRTVLERATEDGRLQKIGSKDKVSFDIVSDLINPNLIQKIKNGTLTAQDFVTKDGTLIFGKSGASFKFLPALNEAFIQAANMPTSRPSNVSQEEWKRRQTLAQLGEQIINKINAHADNKVAVDEAVLDESFNRAFNTAMNTYFQKEKENWKKLGVYDTEKTDNGEKYKYLNQYGKTEEDIDWTLENYMWNDMFATINIIELTATDLAYYRNVEDFQKRFSQVHAPSMKLNTEAYFTKNGKRIKYSADGMSRTMYLKDSILKKSEIIDNVVASFNQRIDQLSTKQEKEELARMRDLIASSLENINIADAQGYSSPTSYRKKMAMAGEWDDTMEEAYDRIREGNFGVNDLGVIWQPLKPFVYSQISKNSGVSAMANLRIGIQNKNSEYLLFLADAIMRGQNTGKPNRLKAIYDFMEQSAYDSNGNYNGIGIDTVQFESAVNVGSMGAIDISQYDSYEKIMDALNTAAYGSERPDVLEADSYNEQFVHTFSFEDYGIQQEVPAHLQDHMQQMGSQMRILSISDISEGVEDFQVYAGRDEYGDPTYRTVTKQELVNNYKENIAANIKQSFDTLMRELNLDSSKYSQADRNRALSKILTQAVMEDQRYGEDLRRAVQVDDNGNFVIPLSDPLQSIRVQQLVNSIIKSRINKQKVPGGPVVQVSSYGLSEDLNIRYKDKNGNLLLRRSEFEKNSELKGKYGTFESYLKAEQDSLAYFESYITIPSRDMEIAMTKPDGTMMTLEEALENGILTEESLKAIAYRIPTEDKYSMMPIKVVGFLPKAAGEAIMLPREITQLTGSDFDKYQC